MDASKWLTREALEERAAYYDKWATDIRAMNGRSVDADHSEQTAAVLRFLARWREEALQVERSWDAQAIAKLLNLKPGEDIRAAIQPAISDLTKRLEEANAVLKFIADDAPTHYGSCVAMKQAEIANRWILTAKHARDYVKDGTLPQLMLLSRAADDKNTDGN